MPVVSPYILYVSGTAYDLRKVSAVVPSPNPLFVDVRFIDEPKVIVQFDRASFEVAWQAALVASLASTGTFINPGPVPYAVGGIAAGTSFPTYQTSQQMWDALLYPNLQPQFLSFDITGETTPCEVGNTIPDAVTFTWTTSNPGSITANSIDIYDVTGGTTLATGKANDGVEAITLAAPIQFTTAGQYQFRIQATKTSSAIFSRLLTFSWQWKLMYGASANTTLTEAQILGLASNRLTSSYAGSYAMAAGGYKYICQSDEMGGQLTTVKDANTGFDVPMASGGDYSNVDGGGYSYDLVSVTNIQGVTSDYRVYRTYNALGSAITLAVT